MADVTTVVYAVLAALAYSLMFFAKHHFKPDKPESFDKAKLGATLIIGAIIGIVFCIGNVPITAEAIGTQLISYGFIIMFVETCLKIGYRIIAPRL
ncbi:hypothetical protein ES703_00053 [subsurface metagenome]